MGNRRLLVLGAGSFARVVATTAKENGWDVAGFVVDDKFYQPSQQVMGRWVRGLFSIAKVLPAGPDVGFVAGFVSPEREFLYVDMHARGYQPTTVVARQALARFGDDLSSWGASFVNAGAVVDAGTTLNRGVIVNRGATVGHDCTLGDFSTIGPGAHLAGGVTVCALATVGMGACVLEGRRVGLASVVGAGAVVTRDVPPHAVVMGVPAKVVRCADG